MLAGHASTRRMYEELPRVGRIFSEGRRRTPSARSSSRCGSSSDLERQVVSERTTCLAQTAISLRARHCRIGAPPVKCQPFHPRVQRQGHESRALTGLVGENRLETITSGVDFTHSPHYPADLQNFPLTAFVTRLYIHAGL